MDSVALSSDGTIVAIGADRNDGTASNAGHVRVFNLTEEHHNMIVNDKVGIGIINPSKKLEVVGDSSFTGHSDFIGTSNFTGDVTVNSSTSSHHAETQRRSLAFGGRYTTCDERTRL